MNRGSLEVLQQDLVNSRLVEVFNTAFKHEAARRWVNPKLRSSRMRTTSGSQRAGEQLATCRSARVSMTYVIALELITCDEVL